MPAPPVTIYITSLTSHPTVRSHTELLHRSLNGYKIPYEAFDLVMDEDAKTRWQRAKPAGKVVGLPGYLVAGEWIGTMDDFENAVEGGYLKEFLKQDLDLDEGALKASTSDTITQAELDDLMKGMSDGDLDRLAADMDGGPDDNKPTDPSQSKSRLAAVDTDVSSNGDLEAKTAGSLPAIRSVPLGSPVSSNDSRSPRAGDRKSKEDLAREMAEAGSMDGILAALEQAEGK